MKSLKPISFHQREAQRLNAPESVINRFEQASTGNRKFKIQS